MPQFYTPAASASSRPPRRSAYGYGRKSGKDFCWYYFCSLCNPNLHSQQNTHAASFQTFSLRSLSSSLLCQTQLLKKNPRLPSPPRAPMLRQHRFSRSVSSLVHRLPPFSSLHAPAVSPLQVRARFSSSHLVPLARGSFAQNAAFDRNEVCQGKCNQPPVLNKDTGQS